MTTDGSASKGPPDPAAHFNTLIGAYTEAIRVSDFKANLAVLFVAIMMGPIVAYRGKYPSFLSLPLVLAIVVYPRYPKRGRASFLVTPNPRKSDFVFVESEDDNLEQRKLTCAILSGILFWKTLCLTISMTICLVTIAVIFFLLLYSLF
jgi:hypothetical protein